MSFQLLEGNASDRLATLPSACVDCIVTSPPYWQLRDYGLEPSIWGGDSMCSHSWDAQSYPAKNGSESMVGCTKNVHSATRKTSLCAFCSQCGAWRGQLGLEPTIELFLDHLVEIFRELRRVLKPTGTAWVNMGDSYSARGGKASNGNLGNSHSDQCRRATGIKAKCLVGMPWRLALALDADGWYLRRDIVWEKPNAMPESVTDRPATAHEYLFLLTKSPRYYYNAEAIKEKVSGAAHARGNGVNPKAVQGSASGHGSHSAIDHNQQTEGPTKFLGEKSSKASDEVRGSASGRMGRGAGWRNQGVDGGLEFNADNEPALKLPGKNSRVNVHRTPGGNAPQSRQNESFSAAVCGLVETRNARSVWSIPSQPRPEAHFAAFPDEIPRRCILAGCPPDGVVLDPFGGRGTTGCVALSLGRSAILIETSPDYCEMIRRNVADVQLPLGEAA